MKRKNLILGLIAIVFAVGSALATDTVAVKTYVFSKATSTSPFVLKEVTPGLAGFGSYDGRVAIYVDSSATSKIVFGRNVIANKIPHFSQVVVSAALVDGTTPYSVR